MYKFSSICVALCGQALMWGTVVTLGACTEEVINPLTPDSGGSEIRISTRGGTGPDGSSTLQAQLYCFDKTSECFRILTPDVSSGEVLTQLPPGDYTICAIGSDDLTAFTLPSQSTAQPTSEIALVEGRAMPDLLMKSQTLLVTASDVGLNLSLERKVLCLTDLAVSQVPSDVTGVSVELINLHSKILLNGSLTDDVSSRTFSLTQGSGDDADVWSLSDDVMLLPSDGNPGVNITFVKPSDTMTYSYTLDTPFEANQKVSLKGTYGGSETFKLSVTLTSQDWDSPRTITFDFNESNASPVAGQKYNGYYVLSVDESSRTCLVRTKNNVDYSELAADAPEADWLSALNTAMAGVEKPANAVGDWRIPTYDEALIFVSNPAFYPGSDVSNVYFCMNNNVLEWVKVLDLSTNPSVIHGTNYDHTVLLRPVIVISY